MKQTEFKVFGDTAKKIDEGDEFLAKVEFVEGRKVVKLVYINPYLRDNPEAGEVEPMDENFRLEEAPEI